MLTQVQLYNVQELQLKMLEQYPMWRKGQAFFNAMYTLYPDIANSIRGRSDIDCFYKDENIRKIRELSGDINLRLSKFLSLKESLTNDLKKIVQDKDINLDIRWELFIKSGLGDQMTSLLHLNSYNLDDFYDNFCFDRYQTVDIDWMIENIIEKYLEDNEDLSEDSTNEEVELAISKIINPIKEEILSKFIKSFEFDW